MEYQNFHHLGREWEAAILRPAGDAAPVRFRSATDSERRTYEARIHRDELEDADDGERELALRRALESALVLRALSGWDDGLTLEEVAERTGMPRDAAEDRLHKLDSVQPLLTPSGIRRYRVSEGGDGIRDRSS
jgi:hypothetical protein